MAKQRTFVGEKDADRNNKIHTNYQNDLNVAERARNNQRRDTDPMIEKEGFMGIDDLDKMRRNEIGKIY
jgi:hypothetical protein